LTMTDLDSNQALNAPISSTNNEINNVVATNSNPANDANTSAATVPNPQQQLKEEDEHHAPHQPEPPAIQQAAAVPQVDETSNAQTNQTNHSRKRSREEMNEPETNTNCHSNSTTTTPSNEQIALNVSVEGNSNNNAHHQDIAPPPAKKMKAEESKTNTCSESATHHHDDNKPNLEMPAIPNANSDAFDENPYLPTGSASYSNSANPDNENNHVHSRLDEGQVLKRNPSDLKRYLSSMDEEILKNDLVAKLCENHQSVMDIIRHKMSEHTTLCKIFIRSLSYDTKDQTVYNMFTKYGKVKEAVIVTDRQTGKSRGFGFITMSNASEAQAALVEHRKMIDNREAICNLASKPQGQKTSSNTTASSTSSSSKPRREEPSFHASSSSRSDRHSRSKRGDSTDGRYSRHISSSSSSSRNNRVNAMAANVATAYPAYPPAANPYGYDYASAAAANTAAATPAYTYPPSAYPQYMYPATAYAAQYNRAATTTAATANANTQNAATANANATMANQPYAPYQPAMAGQNAANMATFGAAPYRFT